MGCRIIEGVKDGRIDCAVFYCSTTEWAFGPVMESVSQAVSFATFLQTHPSTSTPLRGDCDPRSYSEVELRDLYALFVRESKGATA